MKVVRERLLAEGVDEAHIIEVSLDRKENIHLRNAIALVAATSSRK